MIFELGAVVWTIRENFLTDFRPLRHVVLVRHDTQDHPPFSSVAVMSDGLTQIVASLELYPTRAAATISAEKRAVSHRRAVREQHDLLVARIRERMAMTDRRLRWLGVWGR